MTERLIRRQPDVWDLLFGAGVVCLFMGGVWHLIDKLRRTFQ